MRQKDPIGKEQRKYIRLDSVFPVQFRLTSSDGKAFLSEWLQGFTNNIGKGGICLTVNNLSPDLFKNLKVGDIRLSLNIEIPLTKKPVPAKAGVAWVREIDPENNRCLIGLSYEEIEATQNNRIIRNARAKKLFFPFALTTMVIFGLGFAINGLINIRLIQNNKAIVGQLMKIVQESNSAREKAEEINKEREDLQIKIQELEASIQRVERAREEIETTKTSEVNELNALVAKLSQELVTLQDRLNNLKQREDVITEEIMSLDKRKVTLQKANLEKMYEWLKIHQNPRTGLVISFEGDKNIENWAFTYDQALAILAYSNFSDFERARKILDFFQKKAKKQDGFFLNSYYVNDLKPAEYVMHSGPNIWLGIAAVQYTQKAQDKIYLGLAEEIAQRIITLQNQDSDGGISGGPRIEWYATEHNLDAYAFFNMLYKITAKQVYLKSADKSLDWLVKHTYAQSDIPIMRGKGDSTIATDTYAWSIAAIGPEKLEELGMNPDRIVEFAEENCAVEASFSRPEGQVIKIKGFDFAPTRHVARGGVVSSEWTAQMVLAFKIMADFYYKKGIPDKARSFELKAETYLAELGNMIVSSPSPSGQGESCLPYATVDYVDTGHGWMTPKGSRTGSVSGTAYTLFAYYKYNPLELKD